MSLHIVQPIISTQRLDLHHLRGDHLIELFETRDDVNLLIGKGFSNPYRVLVDFQGPLAWRVPQVIADHTVNKWFVRWIVLRESQEIIGSASFHGAPDQSGMVEIGLGIEPAFQGNGYAKEALMGLWDWALSHPEVNTLRYTVSPSNLPSIAVVKSFGFTYCGQQEDEIDGPEDVYEMTRQEFQEMKRGRDER